MQELKKTAFEGLGLPLQVCTGHVGSLKITINWTSFAVQLELEDVYAVVKTKADVEFDDARDEKSKFAAKEAQLKIWEAEDMKAAKEKAYFPSVRIPLSVFKTPSVLIGAESKVKKPLDNFPPSFLIPEKSGKISCRSGHGSFLVKISELLS